MVMKCSQVAPKGSRALLMLVLGASTSVASAGVNTDCVTNALSFTMQMVDVNIASANYVTSMTTFVANALDTLADCVTIEAPYTPASAAPYAAKLRRLDTTVFSPGIAGVMSTMSQQGLQAALMSDSFKTTVCNTFKTSDNCTITDVWAAPVTTIGTTTTTTEMPWGLPWWVWFFIFYCCLALCGAIFGGAGASAGASGGSRKKKSPHEPSRLDEPSRPQYEVVDVPGPGPNSNPYNSGPGYGQPPYNSNPSGYY